MCIDSRRNLRPLAGFLAFALVVFAAVCPVRAAHAASSSTADGTKVAEPPRLPPIEGRTLDGKRLATTSFAGKRLLLFCFNPGVEQAAVFAQVLAKVAPEQTRHNFAIVGVAMGLDPAKARDFAKRFGLDFPIFDDAEGRIGPGLGLQSPLALFGTDAEGRAGLAMAGFQHQDGQSVAVVEAGVREFLRLPRAGEVVDGKLEDRPMAPPFEAELLEGDAPIRLADLSGKPVVLVFFLSSCSHCQDALRLFKTELARLPEKARPAFVGIATDGNPHAVQAVLAEKKLDFFPIAIDRDRKIATAYGAFAGVPDIALIDATGHIVYREMGWNEKHDPNVVKMQLARLVGNEIPMLLKRDGFSGNDACVACHPKQAATWSFTAHAFAFDTLVTRTADRDPECIGCHVVGFGKSGGYSETGRESHLEDVGCEDCHGRGGGHLQPRPAPAKAATEMKAACESCHDPKHSLGFDYATFLPKVSHAVIASLGDADRARLVAERERPRDLLPKSSDYAGSATCRNCHDREYSIWSRSVHARSVESLRNKDKEDDARCIGCHVTGYGRPGGFPEGGKVRSQDDLARVGCESCHGPGAEHVKDGGKHAAGVIKLGDKCDSCVILQICGACHDDANDPGFRFNVEHKIEIQRHGTPKK